MPMMVVSSIIIGQLLASSDVIIVAIKANIPNSNVKLKNALNDSTADIVSGSVPE
jgi:hypothetical protein